MIADKFFLSSLEVLRSKFDKCLKVVIFVVNDLRGGIVIFEKDRKVVSFRFASC